MSSDAGVYATAIGQANGKQWNDDVRLHRTTKFLKALSEPAGMPAVRANGLVIRLKGPNGCRWVDRSKCRHD